MSQLQRKPCPKCGEEKKPPAFGVSRKSHDGLQSWCKKCRGRASTERAFERRRTDPSYRARRAASDRKTKTVNAQRVRVEIAHRRAQRRIPGTPEWARNRVHQAVYRGALQKPTECESCGGEVPRRQLHGHHWHGDYAGRPLDVQWLCALCHGAHHRESRGRSAEVLALPEGRKPQELREAA